MVRGVVGREGCGSRVSVRGGYEGNHFILSGQ